MDMDEALMNAKYDLVDKLINDPYWDPHNRLAKHLRRCREVLNELERVMLAAPKGDEILYGINYLNSLPDFYQL
jgi:3-deoxy-D-arabino-heptulosonate 7-phosphate (DAHP) synthase